MKEIILIKLGEIVLKGLNRNTFEAVLLKNIKRRLAPVGNFSVRTAQSTVYVEPKDDAADMEAAAEKIRKIFGIAAFSRAGVTEKSMDAILPGACEYLREQLNRCHTFKVEAKRSDKAFPYTSPENSAEELAKLL